jgi:hypothetical protein
MERAIILNTKNVPTESARKEYIDIMVAYKTDNAIVVKHPPIEDI